MSDDRAIEVLAEALRGYDLHAATRVELAGSQVEALASAGFQITDLTPEEASALTTGRWDEDLYRSGIASSSVSRRRTVAENDPVMNDLLRCNRELQAARALVAQEQEAREKAEAKAEQLSRNLGWRTRDWQEACSQAAAAEARVSELEQELRDVLAT